jgi:hypothetical protein
MKTEKEFEKEFGQQRRDIIQYTWLSPDMDYLFGMDITNIAYNIKHIDGWSISKDMYKIIPNYKPKKFSREI